MSRCKGCYHAIKEEADPKSEYCRICIRNPIFPTTRMPETAIIEGITVTIPQDMYISKDRKRLEGEKQKREKTLFNKAIERIKRRKEKEKEDSPYSPYIPYPYTWVPDPKAKETWQNYRYYQTTYDSEKNE